MRAFPRSSVATACACPVNPGVVTSEVGPTSRTPSALMVRVSISCANVGVEWRQTKVAFPVESTATLTSSNSSNDGAGGGEPESCCTPDNVCPSKKSQRAFVSVRGWRVRRGPGERCVALGVDVDMEVACRLARHGHLVDHAEVAVRRARAGAADSVRVVREPDQRRAPVVGHSDVLSDPGRLDRLNGAQVPVARAHPCLDRPGAPPHEVGVALRVDIGLRAVRAGRERPLERAERATGRPEPEAVLAVGDDDDRDVAAGRHLDVDGAVRLQVERR